MTWIAVFLGNPGKRYENTRHNAGFIAAEALSGKLGIKINRIKYRALTAVERIGGEGVFLMMPQTYMNLSGESLAPAARFYNIEPERVIAVFDDMSLEPGRIRVRKNGSDGGHNGVKSLIAHMGSEEFNRVKIGIGRPPHDDFEVIDWVTGKMARSEYEVVLEAAERAAMAVEEIVKCGADSAMNKYNGK